MFDSIVTCQISLKRANISFSTSSCSQEIFTFFGVGEKKMWEKKVRVENQKTTEKRRFVFTDTLLNPLETCVLLSISIIQQYSMRVCSRKKNTNFRFVVCNFNNENTFFSLLQTRRVLESRIKFFRLKKESEKNGNFVVFIILNNL